MTNVPPPTPGKGGELVYPQQPPKDPILILVLNLLVAGCLGYFMIGQKMKGIVSLIAVLVLAIPTCGAGSLLVSVRRRSAATCRRSSFRPDIPCRRGHSLT